MNNQINAQVRSSYLKKSPLTNLTNVLEKNPTTDEDNTVTLKQWEKLHNDYDNDYETKIY